MMRPKVLIGYPVGGSCHPAFTKSLLDLQRFELLNQCEYELLPVEYSAGLYVQENRNVLVEIARDRGADWLFQLDTDEAFPETTLRSMMSAAHPEQRPIVFGVYSNVMMGPEGAPGSFYVVDMIYREVASGEYENIVPPSDGRPFVIDAAGSGALLTHMSVFEKIEYPWFWLELIVPNGKPKPQIMNEDIAFCRRAREAGFTLWCQPVPEITHFKSIALLPSTFRAFMERAKAVRKEMGGEGGIE